MSQIQTTKTWKATTGLAQPLGRPVRASSPFNALAIAPDNEFADQKRLDAQAFLMFGTVCEILDVFWVAAGATAASATWLVCRLRGRPRSRRGQASH